MSERSPVGVADEILAVRSQRGDEFAMRALVERHRGRAFKIASSYFLAGGGDRDDVRQEALIGLVGGVRSFDPAKQIGSFGSWLELCIRRQVITSVKRANRLRHKPLNDAVLFSVPVRTRAAAGDIFDITLGDALPDPHADPHRELVDRDDFRGLIHHLATELTELERAALVGFVLEGRSYREIDDLLLAAGDDARAGRAEYSPIKVVDNALSRARRKAKQFVEERDAA